MKCECKKCKKREFVLNKVYELVDEARKATDERLNAEYVHGILQAALVLMEGE